MSARVLSILAVAISLAVTPCLLRAQTGESQFVLLPVGARAVGMGQSVVAEGQGTEQVWWNPAGIYGDGSTREIAIHHADTFVGQDNTLSFLIPSKKLGAFAVTVRLLDLGQQSVTDNTGAQLGTISTNDVAYVLTYAYRFSSFLTLGASLKHAEMNESCSGFCANVPAGGSKSNGVDLGARFAIPRIPVMFGLAATNLGIGTDGTKPARFDLGANYRVQALDKYTNDVEVYTAANVMTTSGLDSASTRLGVDVVLEKKIHVRAGYIVDHANGSGAAIGIGFGAGRFAFDLARTFGGIASDSDHPPTYFSLRYLW